ncbi:Protein IDA [Acorus calamus]|uniref:Protein IDA n=1 Tax=Acorus calamus TaxID=4465 RepID=A0AAV9DZB4_ACOCL|nr:Protein IDA [Acorus calamus]
MAASKQQVFSLSLFVPLLLLLIIDVPLSCNGATAERVTDASSSSAAVVVQSLKIRRFAMTFDFLPRGVPIPPSGPSKRHNRFIDATRVLRNDTSP